MYLKRTITILLSVLISGMSAMAQTTADTISTPQKYRHKTFFRVVGRTLGRFMRDFSEVDTNYIEPPHLQARTVFRLALDFPWLHFRPEEHQQRRQANRI